jgi:hypothetical protein
MLISFSIELIDGETALGVEISDASKEYRMYSHDVEEYELKKNVRNLLFL